MIVAKIRDKYRPSAGKTSPEGDEQAENNYDDHLGLDINKDISLVRGNLGGGGVAACAPLLILANTSKVTQIGPNLRKLSKCGRL